MLFRYLYTQTGLNRFHSADLGDMRRALLDEDQDGPDGGSADISVQPARRQHRVSGRPVKRWAGRRSLGAPRPGPETAA